VAAFTDAFKTMVEEISIPCSVDIQVLNIKQKRVELLIRLVSPDGETIKILRDKYHDTDSHCIDIGDRISIYDIYCKPIVIDIEEQKE